MKKIYKHIPNLFTLFNLFFGCMAIVFFLKIDEGIFYINSFDRVVVRYPQEIWYGALCVGIAAIIDFLDGFIARWLKVHSELGKQLDSLSDVVSFGVAPSILIYQLLHMGFGRLDMVDHISIWWISIAFLIAMSAAYRLGKFNLKESQYFFIGLPTPMAGIFIVSLVPIIWIDYFNLTHILIHPISLYIIIFFFSYIMNSNYKFLSLKKINFKNINVTLTILLFIALVILLPLLALPISILTYIIANIFFQSKI